MSDDKSQPEIQTPIKTGDPSLKNEDVALSTLSDFIISLIQALLRTGYYTPDHPQSEKAREGLHTRFRELSLKRDDLSFLIIEKAEKRKILVEGLVSQPCHFVALMPAGMAELYDEKLRIFLERKELISVTLKQRMAEKEFYDFIEVVSKPILTDIHDKDKRNRFISFLQEKGIKNVSLVFDEDLIQCERNIPWRAWIAMSRLKKDISMIPILRNLNQEDLKVVKKEVVSDVMRPLRDPKLTLSTLVNSDLIRSKIMTEEEIEEDIIDSFSEEKLSAAVEELVGSYSSIVKRVPQKQYEDKLRRIVCRFAGKLSGSANTKSEELLEKLYNQGILSFDDLPPEVKDKILLKSFMDAFLQDPDAFLAWLDGMLDEEQYRSLTKSVFQVIPLLIEKNRFQEIHRILLLLKFHANEGTARSAMAAYVLKRIESSDIPATLKNKFMSGNKEIRMALKPIFVHFESSIAPHLLTVIEEAKDKWARKNAVEFVLHMGEAACSRFEQALKSGRYKGEAILDIIKALITLQDDESKEKFIPFFSRYRRDPDPEIRRHVLILLAQAEGVDAEESLVDASNDLSLEVRKTAIKYLGMIKSRKAFPVFLKLLKKAKQTPSEENEQIENQIFRALGFMDTMPPADAKGPEEILLEILGRRFSTSRFSRFFKRKECTLRDEAIGIICESLGNIGSERSKPLLAEITEHNEEKPWIIKARRALEQIAERCRTDKERVSEIDSSPDTPPCPP